MKSFTLSTAVLVAALATAGGALAQAARREPSVDIRDAAARVVVIPELRGDIVVQITGGDRRLPQPQVRREGELIVVDGGLAQRIGNCSGARFDWNSDSRAWNQGVDVRGIGRIALRDLPVITVRTPMHVDAEVGGAVWGEVGASDQLRLDHSGCGDWKVAPVRGEFDLTSEGSGDTLARTADRLNSAIRGSGDVSLESVTGATSLANAGSGSVRIGRVSGSVSSTTAGSGDVHISRGRAPDVAVRITGSGSFVFEGEALSLAAKVFGSGDVRVARVDGPVAKSVQGSGEVVVGER